MKTDIISLTTFAALVAMPVSASDEVFLPDIPADLGAYVNRVVAGALAEGDLSDDTVELFSLEDEGSSCAPGSVVLEQTPTGDTEIINITTGNVICYGTR